MNLSDNLPKSEMLRRSMRCFVLGWWSLVPLLGVVPALLAFADFRAVVLHKGRHWNAARLRLLLGAWLAGFGLLFSVVLGTLIAIGIIRSLAGG